MCYHGTQLLIWSPGFVRSSFSPPSELLPHKLFQSDDCWMQSDRTCICSAVNYSASSIFTSLREVWKPLAPASSAGSLRSRRRAAAAATDTQRRTSTTRAKASTDATGPFLAFLVFFVCVCSVSTGSVYSVSRVSTYFWCIYKFTLEYCKFVNGFTTFPSHHNQHSSYFLVFLAFCSGFRVFVVFLTVI